MNYTHDGSGLRRSGGGEANARKDLPGWDACTVIWGFQTRRRGNRGEIDNADDTFIDPCPRLRHSPSVRSIINKPVWKGYSKTFRICLDKETRLFFRGVLIRFINHPFFALHRVHHHRLYWSSPLEIWISMPSSFSIPGMAVTWEWKQRRINSWFDSDFDWLITQFSQFIPCLLASNPSQISASDITAPNFLHRFRLSSPV